NLRFQDAGLDGTCGAIFQKSVIINGLFLFRVPVRRRMDRHSRVQVTGIAASHCSVLNPPYVMGQSTMRQSTLTLKAQRPLSRPAQPPVLRSIHRSVLRSMQRIVGGASWCLVAFVVIASLGGVLAHSAWASGTPEAAQSRSLRDPGGHHYHGR